MGGGREGEVKGPEGGEGGPRALVGAEAFPDLGEGGAVREELEEERPLRLLQPRGGPAPAPSTTQRPLPNRWSTLPPPSPYGIDAVEVPQGRSAGLRKALRPMPLPGRGVRDGGSGIGGYGVSWGGLHAHRSIGP